MDSRISTQSIYSLPKPTRRNVNQQQTVSFHNFLNNEIRNSSVLKISKHAQYRMDTRGIDFSAEKWLAIQEKVKEARIKGVKDSLVITQDAALVVSAQNNTVITVLNRDEAKSQIFTNINGTILID
ncbi:TIGR02530 family flagellar biosynthesis protein [Halalkalibacter krulwichiae]|uniref:Flagellar operon protein n=1 Tax=Halalkalibacter krulwichiae TaxID=199441 RepID=A0A1X9MED1_9BACI|nr:TIGR02530 family flagellar biosynthesis protein [Halalkalibacter krulwichiae]ARK30994.1 hypothetical protein BkAM31D_14735 [Halalkalibacter krulwichiae]